LAASATVDAGDVLGKVFVDDPLMRYYFEGAADRSEPVRQTMTLATRLTLRHGIVLGLDLDSQLTGVALDLAHSLDDLFHILALAQ